jgi:hypothetical protein
MITVLDGLAEFERSLIQDLTPSPASDAPSGAAVVVGCP